jgi:hypothetical protein
MNQRTLQASQVPQWSGPTSNATLAPLQIGQGHSVRFLTLVSAMAANSFERKSPPFLERFAHKGF